MAETIRMNCPVVRGHRGRVAAVGVTVLAAMCTGCSPAPVVLAPVRGKVTYKGSPVVAANVVFVCEYPRRCESVGLTDEDGNFTLTTNEGRDGCPAGRCGVVHVK